MAAIGRYDGRSPHNSGCEERVEGEEAEADDDDDDITFGIDETNSNPIIRWAMVG